MAATSTGTAVEAGPKRRSPSQRRSRERVERILDTASELIVEDGVPGQGTRKIAARAGVPVASIYQYFADVDEIILELVKRDTAEMDKRLAHALGELEIVSLRGIVTATQEAFFEVYERRPAFVVIWFRGRTNAAVMSFCRAHNEQIATTLYDFALHAGLLKPGTDSLVAELAVEVGDRALELAFSRDPQGDQRVIDDGREMIIGYLERFATQAGLTGVRPPAH
ncbi:MAG: TetR/AcrR family transcriptional regulator [Haloechinothrix sp.]